MFYPAHCDLICKGCSQNHNGWCEWRDIGTSDYKPTVFEYKPTTRIFYLDSKPQMGVCEALRTMQENSDNTDSEIYRQARQDWIDGINKAFGEAWNKVIEKKEEI